MNRSRPPARTTARTCRRASTAALGGGAALLGLLLTATGCAESPAATPAPGSAPADPLTLKVIDDDTGKHAVVVNQGSADDQIENPKTMTSTLTIGAGSCYYITREGGPPSELLVFPSRTSLEGGDVPSVVLDDQRFPQGTLIEVTGGFVQLTQENNDQATPCLATAGAFLVTSASGIQSN